MASKLLQALDQTSEAPSQGQRKQSRSQSSLVQAVSTNQERVERGPAPNILQAGAAGAEKAVATVLGLPADIGLAAENFARRGLGLQPVTQPSEIFGIPTTFGTSQSIERGLERVGLGSDIEVEDLDESGRIVFRGFESFTSSIPFALPPFILARATQIGVGTARLAGPFSRPAAAGPKPSVGQRVAGAVTNEARLARETGPALRRTGQAIVETARTQPGRTGAAEVAAAAGAAQGAGLVSGTLDDDPAARVAGEMVGAVVNPISLVLAAGGPLGRSMQTFYRSTTRAGREKNAALILQDIILGSGDDPARVAALLQSTGEDSLSAALRNLTPAQITGSPGLVALEKKLAERSAAFGNVRGQAFEEGMASLRNLANELTATGDPTALAMAARARQNYYDAMIGERLAQAERRIAEARARFPNPSAAERASMSDAAFDTHFKAMKEMRGIERELWDQIPKDVRLRPDNLRDTFFRLRDEEVLPTQSLPMEGDVRGIVGKRGEGKELDEAISKLVGPEFQQSLRAVLGDGTIPKQTTTGRLQILQKQLSEEAADLRAQGRWRRARPLQDMADAIKEDIGALELPSVQKAAAFSKSFNDHFSRSFGGRVLERTRQGDFRISPEEMLARAHGAGGEAGNRRLRDIEQAGEFADTQMQQFGRGYPDNIQSFASEVRNAEEAFIRNVASQVMQDGQINANALRRFVENNDELLRRFPQVADDLRNAESAAELFAKVERVNQGANKLTKQKSAFARLADVDTPALFVDEKINGDSPIRDYRRLAQLAKSGGRGATQGLKVSTLDGARTAAITSREGFTWRRYRKELFSQRGERRPSRIQLMLDNGVISKQEADNLQRLVNRAVEIEDAMLTQRNLDEIVQEPDAMFDLAVRVAGANLGGASAIGGVAGAPIVAAGAGSRFARRLMEKMPMTRTLDVLIEASSPGNKELMRLLLLKPNNPQLREQVRQRLNGAMVQAGLIPDEEGNE